MTRALLSGIVSEVMPGGRMGSLSWGRHLAKRLLVALGNRGLYWRPARCAVAWLVRAGGLADA